MSMLAFIIPLLIAVAFVCVGIALSDAREVHVRRAVSKHPNARRWRSRPSLEAPDATAQQLRTVRRTYRNVAAHNEAAVLSLHLPPDTVPLDGSLLFAAHATQCSQNFRTMTIPAAVRPESNTAELMRSYKTMLTMQLALARDGLGIAPVGGHPYVAVQTAKESWKTAVYEAGALIASVAGTILFVGSVGLALLASQPELLLVLSGGFNAWAIWSIGRYPGLSFAQKLRFAALLPAAYAYLLVRCASLPARSATRLLRPLGAMMNT